MKVAITSGSGALDAGFDLHFGRASHFCLIDLESEAIETVANPAVSASSGAGIQAAQLMGQHAVNAVISGSFGPKAFQALNTAGITMYAVPNGDSLIVGDVLAQMKAGGLQPLDTPSHGGHAQGKH
jgi:predicted Fe-Mo cluster-binding NifX family protein